MDFIATPWLTWQRAQDADIMYQDPAFNYYNVETVLAVKKGFTIPKGSVTFSMIPY